MSAWFQDAFSRYLPTAIRNSVTSEQNQLLKSETIRNTAADMLRIENDVSSGKTEDVTLLRIDQDEDQVLERAPKGPPGARATIVLPFRLPTWNQILAMDLRQRMKVKRWIRNFVSQSIADAGGSQIPMGSTLRLQLTDLQKAEYSKMIRPSSSSRYATRKSPRGPRKRRRSSRWRALTLNDYYMLRKDNVGEIARVLDGVNRKIIAEETITRNGESPFKLPKTNWRDLNYEHRGTGVGVKKRRAVRPVRGKGLAGEHD